jgi:hypothetical protein
MMRSVRVVFTAFWLLSLLFITAGTSVAKDIRVRAKLEPCCGNPEVAAEGDVRLRVRGIIVRRLRFGVGVGFPIPSAGLGITTPDEATNADVRLILDREGNAYAECFLDVDAVTETRAEYKVDLRLLGVGTQKILQERRGTCDVDLTTPDIDAGIPLIFPGDLATVTLVTDPQDRNLDLDFLDGIFDLE